MLRSESIMMLHQMRKEGKSVRKISQETGLSRNTVKCYLKAQGIPEKKGRKKRGYKLDPFQKEIQEMMKLEIFNCEVIYCRLKELGYLGGKNYSSFSLIHYPQFGVLRTSRYPSWFTPIARRTLRDRT